MQPLLRTVWTLAVLFILVSCAGYKTYLSDDGKKWEASSPAPGLTLKHTMYLIGDAGNDSPESRAPVLEYLRNKLGDEPAASSVLFMGDNIYEYGMPPAEDSAARKVAEFRINSQLEALDNFKGRPIFIPGNHDWRGWGLKGLKRQEKYIQKYLNERRGKRDKDDWEDYFLPLDGCSGPEAVELNDNVVVIIVDSQWWLTDWDRDSRINEGCEIRNREHFRFVFENVVRKYRNKQVVIAMHHPPYTYGPHGGRFTLKQHIFPLTELNPNLYIPLPGLGTLSALFRAGIGSRQDVANKLYRELRAAVLAGAKKNGSFIFASGHEHTLQYIENEGQSFIVSGAGSKNSPVSLGKGSQFATSSLGFSTLLFYEGGETWVNYWQVGSDGKSAKLVFRKKINGKLVAGVAEPVDFAEYNMRADSVSKLVSRTPVKPVGSFHRFLFGEHNRRLYLQPYQFATLDLNKEQGGLTPVKQGGGNQTNSLRLRAATGKEYVLRGLTKDVSRFLPFPFNQMVAAKYLVEDNFLSTNPFAPLAMPVMADAVQVYHTNPKLVYVPAQPGLGIYNPVFGGTMNLLEERPDGKKWKDATFFGKPDKIVGTPEVVENILESSHYKVDEPWALRTRLFDFVVGDWDRHDDQWAWAASRQGDAVTLYRPIPRDRDQAFSMYDGLVTGVARLTLPFLRQLQSFNPEISSMKWTTWSARLFDRTFLNNLEWEEWEKQVKYIQQNLTDEVIDKAFDQWPAEARTLAAPALIRSIRSRRDDLMNIARAHYDFLSKSVNIIGTEENERFVVERLDDMHTRVSVSELGKEGRIKHQNYVRTFDHAVTRELILYGNGDRDEFVVKGNVRKGIRIRLVGGLGNDTFADSSQVSTGGKKTLIYDDKGNNTVAAGQEGKDHRSTLYRYNIYDRRSADSNYDITIPAPVLGANPDDGFLLGANLNVTSYGFKKEPYASLQHFGGSYAFATKGFKLNYTGDFIDALRPFDFFLDTYYHGPTYAFNFAGLGNSSLRPVDDADYYRVRQTALRVYPALKKRFAGNDGFVSLGPVFSLSKIQDTPGRYIASDAHSLPTGIFDFQYFGGGRLQLNLTSVDNQFAPHAGIRFESSFDWIHNLQNDKQFGALRAQLAFYFSLDPKENLTVATQVGTGLNVGQGYEFFQMPTLGGSQGLRGYRTERFYGKSSLWHATDLRFRLGSSYNPTLPLTYGIFGSFDHGRVWLPGEQSGNWHYSYGGGFWLAPLDVLTFAAGVFIPKEKSEEKPRISFRVGYWF